MFAGTLRERRRRDLWRSFARGLWGSDIRSATCQESGSTTSQLELECAHPKCNPKIGWAEHVTEHRYRLSFTAGGLLVREAGVVAPHYRRLGDWAQVRAAIDSDNLLQARTVSSGHRLAREVVQRLAELTEDEIDLLVDASSVERGQLMWAAACRRYSLLGEFAEEVLREWFLRLAPTLDHSHFDSFVRTKAMWHEELAEIKESTYRKLRSNVFLMLHEAGLLSNSGHIAPVVFTDRLAAVLASCTNGDVRFFPANDPVSLRVER